MKLIKLNTTPVAIAGLVSFLISFASDPGVQKAWGDVIGAFPGAGGAAPTKADWIKFLISIGMLVGAVAAYFGKPHTVKS